MNTVYPTTETSQQRDLYGDGRRKELTEHGEAIVVVIAGEAEVLLQAHDPSISDAIAILDIGQQDFS